MLKKNARGFQGSMLPLLFAVPVALIGGLMLIKNYPDMRRYLRMRRM